MDERTNSRQQDFYEPFKMLSSAKNSQVLDFTLDSLFEIAKKLQANQTPACPKNVQINQV